MSPTALIIGATVAVILTVGVGVGLQILDARMLRARLAPDDEVDELEFGKDYEDAALQGSVKVVPRSANGRRKKHKHGR